MALISLTIPDAILPRVIAAVSIKFDFNKNKLVSETQAQFAKRMLVTALKQWVKDGERIAVDVTNRSNIDSFEQEVDLNIVIT